MTSDTTKNVESELEQRPPGDALGPHLVRDSLQYVESRVDEGLHPAFADTGIRYDSENDCFSTEPESLFDEAALFDSQQAFANALEQFQKGSSAKYKSQINLRTAHTWSEVMEQADRVRNEYIGVGKVGIIKKIDSGLRTFQTAAPAIEAWLKLLPSTTIYGSIICGGFTVILEAAVHLKKLRKETLDALDQIPLCIEKAEFFIRTYGYAQVNRQTGDLYLAIIDALQHILEWYKRKAGMKFLGAFCKGPAYAEKLKTKMNNVYKASQIMNEQASRNQHLHLKEIRNATLHTHNQLDDLKILAVEARNHLYAVFKDTEVWKEAVQSWAASTISKRPRRTGKSQAMLDRQEENSAARDSLLKLCDSNHDDISSDVEVALSQLASLPLCDQDRVGAIIQQLTVQEWLLDPDFGGLMIHGNSRRHDPISPASVACAMLIHVFSDKLAFATLYWFCGSRVKGPYGNPFGMIRGLICQLLCSPCCVCSVEDHEDFNEQDLNKLLTLFARLLRRSSKMTPVICIIDGISYYESRHQSDYTCAIIYKLAKLAKAESPILKLLITSPTRTSHIHREPKIAEKLTVVEVPSHVRGAKQGFDFDGIASSVEIRARKMSESLKAGVRGT